MTKITPWSIGADTIYDDNNEPYLFLNLTFSVPDDEVGNIISFFKQNLGEEIVIDFELTTEVNNE
jgi:hypothetical protein